jgi:hypothetical protein
MILHIFLISIKWSSLQKDKDKVNLFKDFRPDQILLRWALHLQKPSIASLIFNIATELVYDYITDYKILH